MSMKKILNYRNPRIFQYECGNGDKIRSLGQGLAESWAATLVPKVGFPFPTRINNKRSLFSHSIYILVH